MIKKIKLSAYHPGAEIRALEFCCGAIEIGPLDTVRREVRDPLARYALYRHSGESGSWDGVGEGTEVLVVFTDTDTIGNGDKIAKYISRHRIGKIVKSGGVRNPNTGNIIYGWVWAVDVAAFDKWAKKNIDFGDEDGE